MKRNILITGASSGIGKELCTHLSASNRASWNIFATVRKESDKDRLIEMLGDSIHVYLMDVTNPEQVRKLADIVEHETNNDGLHALINNAGVVICSPIECIKIDDFSYQFEVNVLGPLRMIQALFAPLRIGRGRILNLGSISSRTPMPYLGAYSASKAALEKMTLALRSELLGSGIHAISVELGSFKTPLWDKSILNPTESIKYLDEIQEKLHARKVQKSIDIAKKIYLSAPLPASIVNSIESILLMDNPKPQYAIGIDAHILRFLNHILPRTFFDFAISKLLA